MKYFMKKIEKMLKSENDDVALQNRILASPIFLKAFYTLAYQPAGCRLKKQRVR